MGAMRAQFDDLVLDTGTRQLHRGAVELHLSPKAFELLAALVEHRDRALSKNEIHQRLWPETFVSETNLAGLVAEIRSVLGDSAQAPRYVRTVFGYGYAFSGSAREIGGLPPPVARDVHHWLTLDNRPLALSEGVNVIGRDPAAAVPLDSSTVSRHHARILVAGREATIEDLASKNGTFVNGERVNSRRLSDGDEIKIGSLALTFRVRADATAETDTL
jgi:DNA-binding winged helix-turn-helix (wHTH) protein